MASGWSLLGRSIAFVRHRDLYVISSAGTRLRRLTAAHRLLGRPVFAPTGRSIAVLSFGCPSHGRCCSALNTSGCVEPVGRLQVIDLRGRVESTMRVGGCYDDGEGSQSCDALGGVAWQPLSSP